MQKHAKNIQKMEPKWELESRTNEKNTWKMGRCTLHVRRCTCNVARATLNGDKWCPEWFQSAFRNSGSYPFGAHLARKWPPEGRQWDPLGVDNGTKNRKMSQKMWPWNRYRKSIEKRCQNWRKMEPKMMIKSIRKSCFSPKGDFAKSSVFLRKKHVFSCLEGAKNALKSMEKTLKNVIRKRHGNCTQHDAKMPQKWVPKSVQNRKMHADVDTKICYFSSGAENQTN